MSTPTRPMCCHQLVTGARFIELVCGICIRTICCCIHSLRAGYGVRSSLQYLNGLLLHSDIPHTLITRRYTSHYVPILWQCSDDAECGPSRCTARSAMHRDAVRCFRNTLRLSSTRCCGPYFWRSHPWLAQLIHRIVYALANLIAYVIDYIHEQIMTD